MQSPLYFIAKPAKGKRYDNTKEIDGQELIVSASDEDHRYANRYAIVEQVPLGYTGKIKIGDTLLVHHNVFKYYNDIKGKQRSGKSFFKDDLFFIDSEQFFMYFDGERWRSYDRYCFVKPIAAFDSDLFKATNEEPLMGEMKYPNDYLEANGISAGDIVSFTPNSEYEFHVDGEKLYRVFDHQITFSL